MIFRPYLKSKVIRNILDDPHISFSKKNKISNLPKVTFSYIPCSRDVKIFFFYEIHLFQSFLDHIYTARSSGIFWMTLIYPFQTKKKISKIVFYTEVQLKFKKSFFGHFRLTNYFNIGFGYIMKLRKTFFNDFPTISTQKDNQEYIG